MVGPGRDEDAVTVFDGIKAQNRAARPRPQGCKLADTEPPNNTPADECGSDAGFAAAVAAAKAADQVVLAVGETREQSGEAAARSEIDLPGQQEELIGAIKATGKPFVVVLFNGRPLTLGGVVGDAPAILEAWFPGVQAGNAVADVVFGKVNPGGKLPVSFPRRVGQVPIYYNHEPTGPAVRRDAEVQLALPGHPELRPAVRVRVRAQLQHVRDLEPAAERDEGVARTGAHGVGRRARTPAGRRATRWCSSTSTTRWRAISQPVRRLRGFERVTLEPGPDETVTFTLDSSDFGFYDNAGKFVVEPGQIDVYAGNSSKADLDAVVHGDRLIATATRRVPTSKGTPSRSP